tara:strand:- start:802 stop:972 length:171 start_codon:yes stop_codon:yes gene_type:complete
VELLVLEVFEVLLDVLEDELDSVYEVEPPPPPPHDAKIKKVDIIKVLSISFSLFFY